FTTMPNLENTYKFMTSSDPHFGASNANRTATNKILDQLADPVNVYQSFYMLGDLVEYGFIDAHYKEACDTFSPVTSHIPFRPVIGNHDIALGGHTFWEDYFSPDLIDAPRDYFHIEVNGIHIFVLDLEWGTESYCDTQKEWFENELEENTDPNDWILVMSHCFYYASGYNVNGADWWDHQEMIDTFEAIFIDNGIDMVFSGHNHIFEVLENEGIYYNIVGGLGGHPDTYYDKEGTVGQAGTGSIYYSTDIFGFLEVDIQGDNANLAFRTPENQIVYNYTVNRL
ncbi:MAG: metallophosphoesterase family protein, partial [Promethearchaeota archaeon]